MRSRLLLFALLIGLTAVLATGAGSRAVARAAAGNDGQVARKWAMRRAQPARSAAKPAKSARARLPVVFAPKASPLPPDPSQCRLGCAQAYYFCLADTDADSCPGPWTSCLAGCSRGAMGP